MNNLDEKILELFRFILSTGTKHLVNIDYSLHILEYNINETAIKLCASTIPEKNEIAPNTYSTIAKFTQEFNPFLGASFTYVPQPRENCFYITVKGKEYRVPKLSRSEEAYALDRLDSVLEEYESDILDSVLSDVRAESREEL